MKYSSLSRYISWTQVHGLCTDSDTVDSTTWLAIITNNLSNAISQIYTKNRTMNFVSFDTPPPPPPPPQPQPFTTLYLGPPGSAGVRRKLLLYFMVLGRITRGRHTDNLGGCHSIRTNQQSTSINPPILHWIFFLPKPSQWDRHRNMLDCICSGLVFPLTLWSIKKLHHVSKKFPTFDLL